MDLDYCHDHLHQATYEDAVSTAHRSVQASEEIVANGAKALYISYNNPPINTVSTQEWLDVDQYWQAFVEKHHYYHNHLDCATEDPESKEYDEKVKLGTKTNFIILILVPRGLFFNLIFFTTIDHRQHEL